ncbi:Hint domain-containing protein [Hyphomicrobium sp. CS1BSMeth3]|uniref:Hint domain-containing protein n=1 Tax=Hyphomicrobium sp. CS1BSMeth3 TaxID=1892844 RepID=UPI0009FAC111|nr:Hint domain-containing protein [Hyphomicrobium sp. CS1BSMeth3]
MTSGIPSFEDMLEIEFRGANSSPEHRYFTINPDQSTNPLVNNIQNTGDGTYSLTLHTVENSGGWRVIDEDGSRLTLLNLPGETVELQVEAVAHNKDGLLIQIISGWPNGTRNGWYMFLGESGYTHTPGVPMTLSANNPNTPFDLPAPPPEPCFAEGVLIRTTRGDIAVEDLKKGDIVITVSGAERPIKWIGQTVAHPGRHPRPHEVNPIRIKAGAFASGLPVRDLRVSPGHAIFVDGVLVPAGCLVNGATIMQQSVETIRYFHVELDSHDVLLAESLACESYLDDGNRASFSNSGEHVALHGRLDPKSWDEACAPIVAAGPQLEEVQHRLQARAEEMGWVRAGVADLAVVADGVRVSPVHVVGNRYWFAVPAAKEVGLQSSSSVLAQVMPGLTDRRTLGVAVSTVRIDGETLDLDSDAFGDGFYPTEHHGDDAWRWTGGAAMLTRTLDGPAMLEIAVRMVAPSWRRPVRELRLVANG